MPLDDDLHELSQFFGIPMGKPDPVMTLLRDKRWAEDVGGVWVDGQTLHVGVVGEARELRLAVSELTEAVFHPQRYSLAFLNTVAERVVSEGDRLGAPWASIGVDEEANLVEAVLTDLNAPASLRLIEELADDPVVWDEGTVIAAAP